MPDVYEDAYDQEQVSSLVRALESAEQYQASYFQKAVANSHGYMATGSPDTIGGGQVWYYLEAPPETNGVNGIEVPRPTVSSTVTIHLHGYFNPTLDTSTFTQDDPVSLDSSMPDGYGGAGYRGDSGSSTVNDKGQKFYDTVIGTGKKSGGSGSSSAIAYIAPGDSLLMEIDNQTSSDGVVGFELPVIERTDEFNL